jgi:hypothetical protein
LSSIKRIILDVVKPHKPSILEIADKIGDLNGVSGVNISLDEMDERTESIKITIEGGDIEYLAVERVLTDYGASIHSIDQVSAGIRIVEEVNTPQDR